MLLFLLFLLICSVIFCVCGGPACRTRSNAIVLYFPCVERALTLLCYIFCVLRSCTWKLLYFYYVIFSACGGPERGTRSVVIVLYFPRVECFLALLCIYFCFL